MRVELGLIAVLLFAGCDRTPQAPPKPTPNPPQTRPAATPQPARSSLMVAGRECSFPKTRMVVQASEPVVEVLVFSDDPPDALRSSYQGNRYYLPFKLDLSLSDLEQMPVRDYTYTAPSIQRRDVPDGIFLDGDRKQLQPYDVHAVFALREGQLTVTLRGKFLQFQTWEDAALPTIVWVEGVLVGELEGRR